MNRQGKEEIVADLVEALKKSPNFYITDIGGMTVNQTGALRRRCDTEGIQMQVIKNTLVAKALQQLDIYNSEFDEALRGNTAVMLAEGVHTAGKLIKEFRKTSPKPLMKAAYVYESLYVGDDQLDTVLTLKSKEQLLGGVLAMLQSPIQNVLGALQNSGHIIAGLVKTLAEKDGSQDS